MSRVLSHIKWVAARVRGSWRRKTLRAGRPPLQAYVLASVKDADLFRMVGALTQGSSTAVKVSRSKDGYRVRLDGPRAETWIALAGPYLEGWDGE